MTNSYDTRTKHQRQYAGKLAILDKECWFADFRLRRHEFGWIKHTRPDVAGGSAILSQVTKQSLEPIHVKKLNTEIKRVKENLQLRVKVHGLNKGSCESFHVPTPML